ncbi:hypothetical protein ALO_16027 [Acetonema longum DSM 6540]|uniref:Uncharacterized protein n=1 Tax=Acetonema longum DSM 6540 TaxID=1009370 RepID=F7NM78_9FIRM|nr:hypothetical protein ALO_16027 [Acetonema longum DSM 6540]
MLGHKLSQVAKGRFRRDLLAPSMDLDAAAFGYGFGIGAIDPACCFLILC